MQNLTKKGLSQIVQISLLSVLSVISIALIWGYISDLSSDLENQLSPVTDCISQKSNIKSACINSDGKIVLSISKFSGEKINNIAANFKGESFLCGDKCGSCILEELNNEVYLSSEQEIVLNDQITASINGCLAKTLSISNCIS